MAAFRAVIMGPAGHGTAPICVTLARALKINPRFTITRQLQLVPIHLADEGPDSPTSCAAPGCQIQHRERAKGIRWKALLFYFIGANLATVVGVQLGIGALAAITMCLPLTNYPDPTVALVMLAGIFYGARYGSSTAARPGRYSFNGTRNLGRGTEGAQSAEACDLLLPNAQPFGQDLGGVFAQ
ncbi:MAG: tripartite tricarboxylate transporter permease, partial [Roseovarius sp.]